MSIRHDGYYVRPRPTLAQTRDVISCFRFFEDGQVIHTYISFTSRDDLHGTLRDLMAWFNESFMDSRTEYQVTGDDISFGTMSLGMSFGGLVESDRRLLIQRQSPEQRNPFTEFDPHDFVAFHEIAPSSDMHDDADDVKTLGSAAFGAADNQTGVDDAERRRAANAANLALLAFVLVAALLTVVLGTWMPWFLSLPIAAILAFSIVGQVVKTFFPDALNAAPSTAGRESFEAKESPDHEVEYDLAEASVDRSIDVMEDQYDDAEEATLPLKSQFAGLFFDDAASWYVPTWRFLESRGLQTTPTGLDRSEMSVENSAGDCIVTIKELVEDNEEASLLVTRHETSEQAMEMFLVCVRFLGRFS